ncbi:MAG: D-tyrosyl-tRNA(Tyr) deacylase [Bacteroidetes bacterium]|nr:D-tyrosyl-tRNA(Tyr) deacylase [Bacteroidota bacterium]
MRAVIQRVKNTSVKINNAEKSKIDKGLLIFIGVENTDTNEDVQWLSGKISRLRIFDDEDGVMNLSINDIEGQAMVISQFTLHAKTKKGNRPSYIHAAKPEISLPIYNRFIQQLSSDLINKEIKTGEFGANMQISLTNDGPVTIIIDTKNKE